MSAGHSHGAALESAPRASERTSIILASIVGVVLFLTALGAVFVWPQDAGELGTWPTAAEGSRWVTAEVLGAAEGGEEGELAAVIVGEEDAGEVVLLATGDPALEIRAGDVIRALQLPDGYLVFADFERTSPLLILAIVYVLAVIAVARWRGLGALLGLVAAFGVVILFTIPALFAGGDPLIVGLVTGSGALFMLLYLAHGPNARTTTAYLGTLAGLSITAALASWAVGASRLTGIWNEEGVHLEFWYRGVSLEGLVLCGIILAGLGVLNDVTITQASAVWELRAVRPDMSRWELFRRGMRVGRDHIASTVYTIAFAYVGAALPTIMMVSLYSQSLGVTLTSAEFAEEVVRTLVGSIGLVLAVPLTTAIGALVVGRHAIRDEDVAGEATEESDELPVQVVPAFDGQEGQTGPQPERQ